MTGIDYGLHTPTINRNPKSGIRYGIASARDLADWIQEDAEPEYYKGCPRCIAELDENFESPAPCPSCAVDIGDGEEWGEPISWNIEADGVSAQLDDTGSLWVFKSPVTTTGRHCSPCAPGAVTIGPDPVPDGPTAYGLPGEWWKVREDR